MQIIVLTSNDYIHALPAFTYLFNKFYPNQNVQVVRYDVRPPKTANNFDNYAIGKQSDFSWSSGLKHYLSQLQDDLVLLMLEDYWLIEPVQNEQIDHAKLAMEADNKIVKFDLTNDRMKVSHKPFKLSEQPIFEVLKSDNNAPFSASVQAAIWNVNFLTSLLKDENAWEFEKQGSKRAERVLNRSKASILGFFNPPMTYVNAIGGMGTKPGEYDFKKFPSGLKSELESKGLI